MPSVAALLDRAADHLTRAADLAEPTDPAFAGQIRLAAATLPAVAGHPDVGHDRGTATDLHNRESGTTRQEGITDTDDTADVAGLLELALDSLDQIPPLDGPADLQLCAWHLHELRRIAATGIAS